MISIGEQIKGVTLKSLSKELILPEDILGRKCVLYFYPKDNTPG